MVTDPSSSYLGKAAGITKLKVGDLVESLKASRAGVDDMARTMPSGTSPHPADTTAPPAGAGDRRGLDLRAHTELSGLAELEQRARADGHDVEQRRPERPRGVLVRALVAVVFAVLEGYHLVRGLLRRQNS
ncbi:hypothetical protein ADK55_02015 [Streptomyces sp. WM4235]|uniref:hypothetical protein n=1 Tax=Streptomyces sp. WM4235 TaxID=1415551 RepID=UPI0006ADA402|nr:hypothetical protein [Streptomyces sp. WM4235]KOU67936.1 hypothetical protein ADK55_02015 [Streptomyces sp. WM4235]